ncbi:MAG: hypothetical protein ACI9EP_000282 [Oceanospirillaceae bacterium]
MFGITAPSEISGLYANKPNGSAVAKTIRPTPKPALNIMENHEEFEKFENSGTVFTQPSLRP